MIFIIYMYLINIHESTLFEICSGGSTALHLIFLTVFRYIYFMCLSFKFAFVCLLK